MPSGVVSEGRVRRGNGGRYATARGVDVCGDVGHDKLRSTPVQRPQMGLPEEGN